MSPSPTIRRNPSRRHTSTLQAGKASESITYGPDGSLNKGTETRDGWCAVLDLLVRLLVYSTHTEWLQNVQHRNWNDRSKWPCTGPIAKQKFWLEKRLEIPF